MSVCERLRLVGEMIVCGIGSVAMVIAGVLLVAGVEWFRVVQGGLVWVGQMWVGLVDLLFGCAVGLCFGGSVHFVRVVVSVEM